MGRHMPLTHIFSYVADNAVSCPEVIVILSCTFLRCIPGFDDRLNYCTEDTILRYQLAK